jgi:hypothetical protein
MNSQDVKTKLMGHLVSWASSAWPQIAFDWRNQKLFGSVWARIARGLLVCGLCMTSIGAVWHLLTSSGWIQSQQQQWQSEMMLQKNRQAELAMQKAKFQALKLNHAQSKLALLEYQSQVDELILAWPNSALRMQLIPHLQKLARAHKLHIVQMKFTPLSNLQGFEVAALDFSLKGPQWATFVYWQSLNQLFQNGIWPTLSWRLLADGDYALEGQVHLLWDAEDAFTDTGVELQAASRIKVEQRDRSLEVHVLPDHPLVQMRLVGAAQPYSASNDGAFWTLLQSGRQTIAVQTGHYLGIENRRVLSLDAKGLWLEGEPGQPSSLLAWDKVPP